jgi:hypothetical protein
MIRFISWFAGSGYLPLAFSIFAMCNVPEWGAKEASFWLLGLAIFTAIEPRARE